MPHPIARAAAGGMGDIADIGQDATAQVTARDDPQVGPSYYNDMELLLLDPTRRGGAEAGRGMGGTGEVKVDLVINQSFETTMLGSEQKEAFAEALLLSVSQALQITPSRLSCVGLQAGSIRATIAISNDSSSMRSAERLAHELVAQAYVCVRVCACVYI